MIIARKSDLLSRFAKIRPILNWKALRECKPLPRVRILVSLCIFNKPDDVTAIVIPVVISLLLLPVCTSHYRTSTASEKQGTVYSDPDDPKSK